MKHIIKDIMKHNAKGLIISAAIVLFVLIAAGRMFGGKPSCELGSAECHERIMEMADIELIDLVLQEGISISALEGAIRNTGKDNILYVSLYLSIINMDTGYQVDRLYVNASDIPPGGSDRFSLLTDRHPYPVDVRILDISTLRRGKGRWE